MDRITLGDDPWSERLKVALRESPHQATLRLWADGKPPTEYDTPYVEYLTTQKQAPPEKAVRMQDAFHALSGVRAWDDPVRFRVLNDGSIGCDDGWHRLNIHLHRGEPLTGRVAAREPDWLNLRDTVRAKLDSGAWKGQLYHPIPHPDYREFPVHHPSPPPIAGMVEKHGIRTALDLGAHFGHALYTLRHHLREGVGVARDPVAHGVASLVLRACGMTAVKSDIVRYLQRAERADLVLVLNVLHHVPLDETLARLRAEFVAVSLPTPKEEGSKRLPPDPYEHVRRKLRASVVWEAPFEDRRLQLLRVDS